MKRSTTTMRLAAVAAASALVLAACGSDSDDDAGSDDSSAASTADGVLTVGTLLPQTGSLSFLGPPEFAGVDLAVEEINAAGGVLGEDVVHVRGDSGDADSGIAPAETDQLLDAGSDVIVGAASSGVSLTVIDKIMSAGAIMFSPANTSTAFDEGDFAEPDLYFRTAPSDILQGAVLSNLLIQDGRQNIAILARQDAYGETLAEEIGKGVEAAGSTVATTTFYGETAQSFDSQVAEIANSSPDAVVLVAFEETTTIVPQLIQAGVGPQDVPTYFVDGNTAGYGAGDSATLPDGTLEGTKGTIPGAEAAGDFQDRLLGVDPSLTNFSYAGESYDAVIVTALAAIAADSDAGRDVAEEIVEVTTGGEKCTTFADCVELLEAGEDIDYDGVSGPIELGDTGSPTAASIGIYQYDALNKISAIDYIAGNI
ncbi:receptor family ligand-binding protein [Aeromicrobium marinum DSM 15272]|uniref:Receptor family ligand-binding protein n=1 Tax=Aeromicrobium marinum DSM 15272 TaxID=585531 RepID=E2S987_9ACTN|nr:ABC transporter substrate-binding protein [Aeromicrobium marinum]EFQ83811.1 receptor family ligand-binding protein [Aeromicrobium marinum DSM 15272]